MKIKPVLLSAVALLFVSFASLLSFNLHDENLNPEALALANQDLQVSPESEKGFNYLLGFSASSEQNPESEGEKIRSQLMQDGPAPHIQKAEAFRVQVPVGICSSSFYCDRISRLKMAGPIQQSLKVKELPLRRLQELIAIGSCGSKDVNQHFLSYWLQVKDLFWLHQFQLQELLAQKKYVQVAADLTSTNHFLVKSLVNPQPVIVQQMLVQDLVNNQRFVQEASIEYPAFKKFVDKNLQNSFVPNLSFEELSLKAKKVQLSLLVKALEFAKMETAYRSTSNLSVGRDLRPLLSYLMDKVGIQPNATVNQFYADLNRTGSAACFESGVDCSAEFRSERWTQFMVNPGGKQLINFLLPSYAIGMRKLHGQLEHLRAENPS